MCLCFTKQILRGWGGHTTQLNHSKTFHVPVFYHTDPSGVGWALPPFTSPNGLFGAYIQKFSCLSYTKLENQTWLQCNLQSI
jgi:hypothetical protein